MVSAHQPCRRNRGSTTPRQHPARSATRPSPAHAPRSRCEPLRSRIAIISYQCYKMLSSQVTRCYHFISLMTRDEPRTLLLEEGKGCKAFPSCPAVSVKMGCRGLCSLLGWGKAPHQRSSTSVASGKIPFRVIRSRHTVRADFRVSRKRNS